MTKMGSVGPASTSPGSDDQECPAKEAGGSVVNIPVGFSTSPTDLQPAEVAGSRSAEARTVRSSRAWLGQHRTVAPAGGGDRSPSLSGGQGEAPLAWQPSKPAEQTGAGEEAARDRGLI